MSVVGNQKQIFLHLLAKLQPHWRSDLNIPERIQRILAREKRFGSRDRRLYRELIYTTLRYLPWVEPLLAADKDRAAAIVAWLAARTPSTESYRTDLTENWPLCPEKLTAKAEFLNLDTGVLFPKWFAEQCPSALAEREIDAMHRRASLWLRLQTETPEAVTEDLDNHEWKWRKCPVKKDAIEVTSDVNVTTCKSYQSGAFEVQDLGSQLILDSNEIDSEGHWLDACAGAGGKTLQLALTLGPQGKVTAFDIRPAAIDELLIRADRAGLDNIRTISQPSQEQYDGVLVDAPCSGSGTWRRAPHLKWVSDPDSVTEYATRQLDLLKQYSASVKPGGQLIYATCSLNHSENGAVVAAFLDQQAEFTVVPPHSDYGYESQSLGLTMLPSRHNTDGFFVASFRRK
mgnify:CR=1 FL=1